MSNDSDFYALGANYVIPLDHVYYTSHQTIASFRFFETQTLCSILQISQRCMPLLAFVSGCDYVTFMNTITMESKKRIIKSDRIGSACRWINQFHNDSSSLLEIGTNMILSLHLQASEHADFLCELVQTLSEYSNDRTNPVGLPKDYESGFYHPKLLEISQSRQSWFLPFLEDTSFDSPWASHQAIRWDIYSVLFKDSVSIEEFQRVGKLITQVSVQTTAYSPSNDSPLQLYKRIMKSAIDFKLASTTHVTIACIIRHMIRIRCEEQCPMYPHEIKGIIRSALESLASLHYACICHSPTSGSVKIALTPSYTPTRITLRTLQILGCLQVSCYYSVFASQVTEYAYMESRSGVCHKCELARGHFMWFDGGRSAYWIDHLLQCYERDQGECDDTSGLKGEAEMYAMCMEGMNGMILRLPDLRDAEEFGLLASGCTFK